MAIDPARADRLRVADGIGARRGDIGATMADLTAYSKTAPTRAEVDALAGATILEFGTDWCGYCQRAQPVIREALGRIEATRHLKIEDGPGRPLGRSFKVKLWPTLIFLRDGAEVARVVRPSDPADVEPGIAALG
jgi:thioredoxin 1